MIKRTETWTGRSTISRWAHVLERTGLALTGASCGLFVAAYVGRSSVDLIGSAAAVLAMMLYGAAGFYLGIDLPRAPPDHRIHLPLRNGLGSRADAVELLTAAGTGRSCIRLQYRSGRDRAFKCGSPDHSRLGDRLYHANCRRHYRANAGRRFRHFVAKTGSHSSRLQKRILVADLTLSLQEQLSTIDHKPLQAPSVES